MEFKQLYTVGVSFKNVQNPLNFDRIGKNGGRMNLNKIKDEMLEIAKRLYEKDLTVGTSGNISVRTDDGILLSASGTSLADLTREDLVLVDYQGNLLEKGKKPTSEKMLHLGIYNLREDLNAVIHCHAPFASAFSVAHIELDKPNLAENVIYFGKIPLAEYALPSSDKLANNTMKYFDKYNAVLMANHGIIVGGKTLKKAFYMTETAETYAKVTMYTKILGKEVLLNKENIKELEDLKASLKL